MGVIMWPFSKRKTCQDCPKHLVIPTKPFGYWVLACEEIDEPIYTAKRANEIDYKIPKWCPKRQDYNMKGEKCSKCNKLAIGYEGHLYCGYNVCKDHASKEVLKLKRGESKRDGVDYYHKY